MNSDIDMNNKINKKKSNPNGVAVLQLIQQKVKEMKQQDSTIKHRTAIALVSEEYRKQNRTIRKVKNNIKCNKCKKCKHKSK